MWRRLRFIFLLLLVYFYQVAALLFSYSTSVSAYDADENIEQIWQRFKQENQKYYAAEYEEAMRYEIWKQNFNYVRQHNENNKVHGYELGLNSFCDLSQGEVAKLKHGLKLNNRKSSRPMLKASSIGEDHQEQQQQHQQTLDEFLELNIHLDVDIANLTLLKSASSSSSSEKVPDNVDWNRQGFVSPIKDQGTCGACWSFVTTGILEAHYRIKNKVHSTYSEQNLMDCTQKYGNAGCDGGLMSQAFDYIIANGGLNSDQIYKYSGSVGSCRYVKTNPAAKAIKYINLPVDEHLLKEAVAKIGPIAAGIDANHRSFTLYKRGIYFNQNCSSENLNHAILIVGYGTDESGKDYWLIKNSWGKRWGMNGFGKMARNRKNHCGISSLVGFPIIPND